MAFLQKSFVGLSGLSIFSAGAGGAYVIATSEVADGAGGLMWKGFFVPMTIFVAIIGVWMMMRALKTR